jgi:hypothetical protein
VDRRQNLVVDEDEKAQTPLHLAAQEGHHTLVTFLIGTFKAEHPPGPCCADRAQRGTLRQRLEPTSTRKTTACKHPSPRPRWVGSHTLTMALPEAGRILMRMVSRPVGSRQHQVRAELDQQRGEPGAARQGGGYSTAACCQMRSAHWSGPVLVLRLTLGLLFFWQVTLRSWSCC